MGNYLWVLALISAWRQAADDDPLGPQMARVDAQAGQLHQPDPNAANDLAAFLLVLVLFWWWNCAKYRARNVVFGLKRLKSVPNEWQARNAPEPAPFLALPAFSRSVPLCQIARPPSVPARAS